MGKKNKKREKNKLGRNDPCFCGAKKPDGTPKKYKYCHEAEVPKIIKELTQEIANQPREPFEKGGFLTGRPFISEIFKGECMRAVKNVIYRRPMDETFHMFILRRLSETLTREWVEAEEKKENPHVVIQWFREAQGIISTADQQDISTLRSVKLTGNMRALLALAYDFYTLQHCGAPVLPKLLNRLRNEQEFQGARYEIAIAGLVARSGFEIEWVNGENKHGEFIGTHKVTKDKAVFEAKSHHRSGVLGKDGEFNAEETRTKIMDHVREAIAQTKDTDLPIVIFDDLNLPLSTGTKLNEKEWFNEVEEHLEKYGFLSDIKYKKCGALLVTNFSWHFHSEIPPDTNELVTHFHINGPYSLRQDTVLQYLDLAAKQYGHVPDLLHEFENKTIS